MRSKLKKLAIQAGSCAYRFVRIPIKWYANKFKVDTTGVRVLLIHNDSVVLVRHWYNGLWVPPGGGIKKHETPEEAALREIKEETGLKIAQLEYLLGAYSNTKEGKRDTVYCFVAMLDEAPIFKKKFRLEISDIELHNFSALPEATSKATRLRISEYINKDISKEIRPWS